MMQALRGQSRFGQIPRFQTLRPNLAGPMLSRSERRGLKPEALEQIVNLGLVGDGAAIFANLDLRPVEQAA